MKNLVPLALMGALVLNLVGLLVLAGFAAAGYAELPPIVMTPFFLGGALVVVAFGLIILDEII